MSNVYLDNAVSFCEYGKSVKKKQCKNDGKGHMIVTIKKKKYKLDMEAGVVL